LTISRLFSQFLLNTVSGLLFTGKILLLLHYILVIFNMSVPK